MNQAIADKIKLATAATAANIELFSSLTERNFDRLIDPQPNSPFAPYMGACKVEEIYRFGTMRVFRYQPVTEIPQGKTPLLLVPSMINRAYIMDLMDGSSLAGYLVCQGVPTYLIDWGTPGTEHNHLSFGFYVDDMTTLAVDAVLRDAKATTLGMLGYCMGGTMALIHAALHPKRIDRLTLLAAPINFHDDGVLSQWARKESFPVDRVVEVLGQMDKMMLQTSFQWLKPLSQLQKLKNLYEGAANPKMVSSFVHLESWLNDNVCVPGQAYREYVTTCYHDNALVNGTLKVNDRPVSLTQVTCPMLNVMAKKDHIVPVESSRIVSTLVSGPVTEVLIDAGHIGVAMGSKAREMFTQVAGFHDRPPAAQADKTTDEPTAGPKKEKRSRR